MSNFWKDLAGWKTYITAIGGLVTGIYSLYHGGPLGHDAAIQLIWASLAAFGLRHSIPDKK